ncbi:hypothetical protein U1Q18_011929 [Sarracenia purpurea var. burkii]
MEVDPTAPNRKEKIKSREIRVLSTDGARSGDEEDYENHGDLALPKPLRCGDTGTIDIPNPDPSKDDDPVRNHHPTHYNHYPLPTNTTYQPDPHAQSDYKPKPNEDKQAYFATKTWPSNDNLWPITQPSQSLHHGVSLPEPSDPSLIPAPAAQSLLTNSGEGATHVLQDVVTELEERRTGEPDKGGYPRTQLGFSGGFIEVFPGFSREDLAFCSGYDRLEWLLWLMPSLPQPLTGEAFQLSIATLSNLAPSHDHTASLGFPLTSVCFRVFSFCALGVLSCWFFWCGFALV